MADNNFIARIKIYYGLAKPGIIYGNALTAIAGFMLASNGHFNFNLFVAMLLGLSFIIGSACVINNIMDRDIDELMARTKTRALVSKQVSKRSAIIYAVLLGLLGILILALHTNLLTLALALGGSLVYLLLYTPLKRRSIYGALVGSIAGAVPPLVGYCAVRNHLDLGAVLIFAIICLWQMPHFYAIAIFRLDDYAAAEVPVLPVRNGIYTTKVHMVLYTAAFAIATIALAKYGYASHIYLVVVGTAAMAWLIFALVGFRRNNNDKRWARKMFFYSLLMVLLFCVMVSLDAFLPGRR